MQINYEQAKVLTSPSSLVLHYPLQIPSHLCSFLFQSPSVFCLPTHTYALLSSSVPDCTSLAFSQWLLLTAFHRPWTHTHVASNKPPPGLHLLLYFHFLSFSLCSAIHTPTDLNPQLSSLYLYCSIFPHIAYYCNLKMKVLLKQW